MDYQNLVVLIGLALAIPTFLYIRKAQNISELARSIGISLSLLVETLCVSYAGFLSFHAKVFSASAILAVLTVVLFYITAGVTKRSVEDYLFEIHSSRRVAQERALREKAEAYYESLTPKEQAGVDDLARQWQKEMGGFPLMIKGKNLALAYVQDVILSQEKPA